jgi:hypothetical protein
METKPALTGVLGMKQFAASFVRSPDGSWLCRTPVSFTGPFGPFTTVAGARYRRISAPHGYKVGKWLSDWHEYGLTPSDISFL